MKTLSFGLILTAIVLNSPLVFADLAVFTDGRVLRVEDARLLAIGATLHNLGYLLLGG